MNKGAYCFLSTDKWLKLLIVDLYLMAFGPLRSVFTPDELNRWMEVMFERGVRLRVDLQPYLEGWHPQVEDEAGAGHDDGAGEIEEMAVEYRRLLPY